MSNFSKLAFLRGASVGLFCLCSVLGVHSASQFETRCHVPTAPKHLTSGQTSPWMFSFFLLSFSTQACSLPLQLMTAQNIPANIPDWGGPLTTKLSHPWFCIASHLPIHWKSPQIHPTSASSHRRHCHHTGAGHYNGPGVVWIANGPHCLLHINTRSLVG